MRYEQVEPLQGRYHLGQRLDFNHLAPQCEPWVTDVYVATWHSSLSLWPIVRGERVVTLHSDLQVIDALLRRSYNYSVIRRLAPFLALLLCLTACGSATLSASAHDGYLAYLRALRSPDPKPVYEMLSAEERKRIPYAQWEVQWNLHESERQNQAKELEASLKTHGIVDASAVLRFEDGKRVTLQKEARGWRLNQALVSQKVASTPEDALTIFSVALTAGRIGPVLQILSKRHRDGITEKLQRFHNSLKSELENDGEVFLVNEKRAELTWSVGELRYRLVLVLEDGDWYVDDIHLGPDPAYDEPEPEPEAAKAEE